MKGPYPFHEGIKELVDEDEAVHVFAIIEPERLLDFFGLEHDVAKGIDGGCALDRFPFTGFKERSVAEYEIGNIKIQVEFCLITQFSWRGGLINNQNDYSLFFTLTRRTTADSSSLDRSARGGHFCVGSCSGPVVERQLG